MVPPLGPSVCRFWLRVFVKAISEIWASIRASRDCAPQDDCSPKMGFDYSGVGGCSINLHLPKSPRES